MDNNCLLLGNELAAYVTKVANLKSPNIHSDFEKHVLENESGFRSVSYVSFSKNYENSLEFSDKLFYVLDGSGIYLFEKDTLRYIAGDIVPAPAESEWGFKSDVGGTKLIEVSVPKKAKTLEDGSAEIQSQRIY